MKNLKLSNQALFILKHCLVFTGETEISQRGDEQLVARRLNNEETIQRRFFMRKIDEVSGKDIAEIQKDLKDYGDTLEGKKRELKKSIKYKEKETKESYDERINKALNDDEDLTKIRKEFESKQKEINEKVKDLDITEKTFELVKKYFDEFGEKNGWVESDGERVEEVMEQLK